MERPKPLRGEIWMFDLDPKKGREQKGIRPCLVVSTDALNRSDFGTVIICPITTSERPRFQVAGAGRARRPAPGRHHLGTQAPLGGDRPDRHR